MLLTLVIILILIGSAVVGSLYSNFLVFYQNFTETENYHKARYASIAAIERAELVIKQREPGYVGSGGWIKSVDYSGSLSDKMSNSQTGFSYLSKGSHNESTVFRKINSQTNRIPSAGNGNIEKLLSSDDSPNYNTMNYENAEIILLYYDKGDYQRPYQKKICPTDCQETELDGIKVAIRLPPYVRNKLGPLDDDEPLPVMQDGYKDDPIVDWQIRGKTFDGSNFTIFATQDAAGFRTGQNDSAIRESHLNQLSGLVFTFANKWNPITNQNTSATIISPKDDIISGYENAFRDVFDHNNSKELQLRLSLLNLVLGGGEPGKRYPFLEYYVDFMGSNPIVSDRYFTIETEGTFGDYNIDNILFKPTITESILRSFTTIF